MTPFHGLPFLQVAFDDPDEHLNRADSERQNPSAFHPQHQSVVLHLLWKALDYVDCALNKGDFNPLRPYRFT